LKLVVVLSLHLFKSHKPIGASVGVYQQPDQSNFLAEDQT